MRISTFNAENLFRRLKVLNKDSWAENRPVLDEVKLLSDLIAKDPYSEEDKAEMVRLLEKYDFDNPNNKSRPFSVVQVRERLYSVSRDGHIKIAAKGRLDWVGWIEFARDDFFNQAQIANTGRVVSDVKADVQLMVEIEDRQALSRFNNQVLGEIHKIKPYEYNLLMDGNDDRGIDIGVLSRHRIRTLRSHIDYRDAAGTDVVFSRDCPEYEIMLPRGRTMWLLGNHFKSKGYGKQSDSDAKRKRQAQAVKLFYAAALKRSKHIVIAGDLNDFPGSDPLTPLLAETDLRDVMTHPSYSGLPGTFDTCKREAQKIDYILLSPALWERVEAVGVERRGIYAPRSFPHYDTVTSDRNAASDHAAVWVDIDL
jgi:endonuclease/exonuclease/phosphatase family metal-dependent hydrolase